MTEDSPPARRGPEQPLHTRKRLAVPAQPAGEPPTRFANLALGLDATFCNIVGLIFTLIGAFLSERLGAAGWILTVFGVVTLLWSFMVTLYANRRVSRRYEVERVMKINFVLVLLAVVVLLFSGMTSDGKVVVAGFAVFTMGFAIAQLLASRGLPIIEKVERPRRG